MTPAERLRRRSRTALLAWLGLLLLATTASAQTALERVEQFAILHRPGPADGQPYLEGKLTWNGEQRGISWSERPASQDNQPPYVPADPVATQTFRADRYLNDPDQCTGFIFCLSRDNPTYTLTAGSQTHTSQHGVDVFVSEPLPRDVFINVTRGFQGAIYLQKNPDSKSRDGTVHVPCTEKWDELRVPPWFNLGSTEWIEPYFEFELYAGDSLVGGSYSARWTHFYGEGTPPPPKGYGVCYFHMHPEVAWLPQGTVLRLQVRHVLQQYPYAMGFAGNHHSFLRIWEYSVDDVIYRRPDLLSEPPESETGGFAALMGLPLVAGLLARRLGRSAGCLALLLLAGCLGGGGPSGPSLAPEESLAGRATSTFVEIPKDAGDRRAGSIFGIVHDEVHVPVRGVHISVYGLTTFTTTDARGRFQFRDLAPAVYTLRFDHPQFRSFETNVEVRGGFANQPTIQLEPRDPRGGDARPHDHNLWQGQSEKPLGEVVLRPRCVGDALTSCRLDERFHTTPTADDPKIVFPGTSEVVVTLQWDPSHLLADRLALLVDMPNHRSVAFAARPPGVPFRIQTTWETSDTGHDAYSRWVYSWFAPRSEARTAEEERRTHAPGYSPGNLAARIEIRRAGTLPLEPAHVDQWDGASKIVGGTATLEEDYRSLPPPGTPCLAPDFSLCHDVQRRFMGAWAPAGAKELRIRVTQSRDAVPAFGFDLYAHAPSPVSPRWNDPSLEGFGKLTPTTTEGRVQTYVVPLTATQTSSEYVRNYWYFAVRPDDAMRAWADHQRFAAAQETSLVPEKTMAWDVVVEAVR